jgi:hypothetical protein
MQAVGHDRWARRAGQLSASVYPAEARGNDPIRNSVKLEQGLEMHHSTFPSRKISETFLEFAAPLLDPLGELPTKAEMEQALQIAFTVWNAVVYDGAKKPEYLVQVRELTGNTPEVAGLIEQLIARKRSLYSDDQRLVGEFGFIEKDGGWSLRVEARSPTGKP